MQFQRDGQHYAARCVRILAGNRLSYANEGLCARIAAEIVRGVSAAQLFRTDTSLTPMTPFPMRCHAAASEQCHIELAAITQLALPLSEYR